MARHSHVQEPPPIETGGCLVRLVWMVAAPIGMFLAAAGIATQPAWSLSAWDGVFWALAGAAMLGRAIDIRHLNGQTAAGEPATPAHLRRYVALLPAVAAAVWAAAHAIALWLE